MFCPHQQTCCGDNSIPVARTSQSRDTSFLPPEMRSYPSPHGEEVMLLSSKCILPQLLPKIQLYPSPTNPLTSIGKDSSSFKMQNPYKSFPTKSFFVSSFFTLFSFIWISFFLLFPFIFFFFPPKVGILPLSGNIISQCLGRIIDE